MLSVELKPADFRALQRHCGGSRQQLAIVGHGNVQAFTLCGLLKERPKVRADIRSSVW